LREETVVVAVSKKNKEEELHKKLAARDFNNRRAAYNRQVSVLRREYADQVAKQRAADAAEEEERRQKLTRQRLERQRRKNMRSASNALREKELRLQREREFNEHLQSQQFIRDAKNERYTAARQLVIDELEEEAPLWLTTPEEIEAAFTPEAEQLLWARPGGILGAPNPSLDSHFWQFETHTWHMEKTYKSQRQVLLEQLEEMAYNEANINDKIWTPERLLEQERLEEKARLRAMVHSAGRTELLKKQREFIQEDTADDEIPKEKKAPSLNVLSNDMALEQEGAKLLMEDPTKFFVFENATTPLDEQNATSDESSTTYAGPTLGAPVALRDPLREGSHDGSVFPQFIGKLPKPDTRSEREKKQAEREERMWAAAQAEAQKEIDLGGGGGGDDEEADDLGPDLDYDEVEWDSDDEEWNRGLDPETDAGILNTPRERRYSEGDIDWVLEKLDGKLKYQEQQFAQDVETIKQEARSERRLSAATPEEENFAGGSLEAALLALSETELMALSDLDETYTAAMPDYEFAAAIKQIPGLTEEQIRMVLTRDRTEDS
jgi:hypothetical protein